MIFYVYRVPEIFFCINNVDCALVYFLNKFNNINLSLTNVLGFYHPLLLFSLFSL